MSREIALVTGASGGIGKQIALDLAAAGYDVVINYHRNEKKALEVKQLCEALGAKVLCISADVRHQNEVKTMVATVLKEFGKIDVLVNNSGITKDQLIVRMTANDFQDVVDTNLLGTFYCLQAVSKPMMKQRHGCIINITSVIGIEGNVGQANYAASKAGVIGLTKSAAKELASRDIRVNAIAPGYIQTEMTDELKESWRQKILQQIPLNCFGSASDVSQLAIFLSSSKAKYITGQVIRVDGGMIL